MSDALRTAIHSGDADALEALVHANPAAVHEDVGFGDGSSNSAPPLHLVCDSVFCGRVTDEQALAMTNVLVEAGLDLEHAFAKSGDSYLISAASLGAERVGLRLVELGADVHRVGLFSATALHWCAFMGLADLARALIAAGSDLELRDEQHECTPLEWAFHAWENGTNGKREGVPGVAAALVEAGACVSEQAREGIGRAGDEMASAIARDD